MRSPIFLFQVLWIWVSCYRWWESIRGSICCKLVSLCDSLGPHLQLFGEYCPLWLQVLRRYLQDYFQVCLHYQGSIEFIFLVQSYLIDFLWFHWLAFLCCSLDFNACTTAFESVHIIMLVRFSCLINLSDIFIATASAVKFELILLS